MALESPLLEEHSRSPQRWFIGLLVVFLGSLGVARWIEVSYEQPAPAAVQKMYVLFGEGKFQGASCLSAARKVALDTVVYDASSDAMPHVSGARVYHGLQGFCDFGAFLSTFRQPDYHLTEMLHAGGTVIVKEVLTPSVIATNKTAPHALENLVEYQVRDGKIASMKVFWGEPRLFDSLFVATQLV
eukprot:Skav233851  [mRNA]  locus=scaffold3130:217060:217617:- [translate_table: standard]